MKIQDLNSLNSQVNTNRGKSAVMAAIVILLGTVFYMDLFGTPQSANQKVLGNYGTSNQINSASTMTQGQITDVLNKYATQGTDDASNMKTCEDHIYLTNYDGQPLGGCRDDTCRKVAKDGYLAGWVSIYLCGEQPNQNISCTDGNYTGMYIDTARVVNFPLLDFLASDNIEFFTPQGNDPWQYVFPYCGYNLAFNFDARAVTPSVSSPYRVVNQATTKNPLQFATNFVGPLYFNSSNDKVAVIPFPRIGSGSACWGVSWMDNDSSTNLDIKSFISSYWDTTIIPPTAPPATDPFTNFWNWLNGLLNSLFSSNSLEAVWGDINDKLEQVYNATLGSASPVQGDPICKNIAGLPITSVIAGADPSNKTIKDPNTYDIQNQILNLTLDQVCDGWLFDGTVRHVAYCTFGDSKKLDITTGNKDSTIGKVVCSTDPLTGLQSCACDKDPFKDCEMDVKPCVTTYRQLYKKCEGMGKPHDVSKIQKAGTVEYNILLESFPYINLPNGNRQLNNVYQLMERLTGNAIKTRENVGLEIPVWRTMYDANLCKGGCTFSGDSKMPGVMDSNFDPVSTLDTGLTNVINLQKDMPYSVKFTGAENLKPVDSSDDPQAVTQSEMLYYYPYLGKIPQMLALISAVLTNQANSDSGRTQLKYEYNINNLPTINNKILEDMNIKMCQDETKNQDCYDPNQCNTLVAYQNSGPAVIGAANCGITPTPSVSVSVTPPVGDGVDFGLSAVPLSKWQDLKNNYGKKFAIVKASEGVTEDPGFKDNWKNVKEAGLLRGAYHFYEDNIPAQQQADAFIEFYNQEGANPDIKVSIDVEEYGAKTGNKDTFTNNLHDLLTILSGISYLGYNPIVYTNYNTWENFTTHPSWASEYPLWVAEYNSTLNLIPPGWTKANIWQYSPDQNLAGISGLDLDKMLDGSGVMASASSNVMAVLGASNTAATISSTDVDSVGTYLDALIYKPNYRTLFTSGGGGGGGGGSPTPNPTTPVPSVSGSISPSIGTSSTPIITNASCPIVQSDFTTPSRNCTEGPLAGTHSGGLYAIDISTPGDFAVAPEPGKIEFYSEGDPSNSNCVTCGGKCLNSIGFVADSGRVYKFGHVTLYHVSNGEHVVKGTIIGAEIQGKSTCSTGSHIHFEIIGIHKIITEYENMCKVTLINDGPGCDASGF